VIDRIDDLEFDKGIANTVDKTETSRVQLLAEGGLLNDGAENKVSDQQSGSVLAYPLWLQRAQRRCQRCLQFIV